MNLSELKQTLTDNPKKDLQFHLHDDTVIPAHFHITEVGHVAKKFIDCGGTVREEEKALLQIWVTTDEDHRVNAGQLGIIIDHGKPVLPEHDLPVEFEYEHGLLSHFEVTSVKVADAVQIQLEPKQTDCMAKDVCCVPEDAESITRIRIQGISSPCDPTSGCC